MGFFNEVVTSIKCGNCDKACQVHIQFKFGATRQLEYKIGDKILWGFNDIGMPGLTKVKVYGVLADEECSNCQDKYQICEFDIFLENDFIVRIAPMEDIKDFFQNDGHYRILVE